MGLEAVRAINWAIFSRLERNLGLLAAARADSRIHLPFLALVSTATTAISATTAAAVAAALAIPGPAALGASRGLIGKALAREEFLFARRERECLSTFAAREGLIRVHALTPSVRKNWDWSVSATKQGGGERNF
jgi:hypothetical protein